MEEMIYGKDNISAGSCSDIKKATKLATQCINEFGFGEDIIFHNPNQMSPSFGSFQSNQDQQIRSIIIDCKNLCMKTIEENKDLILKLSTRLIDKNILTNDDMKFFFNENDNQKFL